MRDVIAGAVTGTSTRTFELAHPADHVTDREIPEDLMTPREVASLFCVNPKTVARWAVAGRLRAYRTLGGHRRFSRAQVEQLLCVEPKAS